MKNQIAIVFLAALGTIGFTAGCSKQDNVAPQATRETVPVVAPAAQAKEAADLQKRTEAARVAEAAQVADAAKAEASRHQAEGEKLAADKAAADKLAADKAGTDKLAGDKAVADKLATDKAAADKLAEASATTAQGNRIQGLIDAAKNLTGQNKYAEALKILSQLSSLNLTPDQQTVVDGVKQTAEKQAEHAATDKLGSEAQKSLGGLLGGKK